ncbi:glucose repression mediator protein [Neophaeococcomyces mojaviensis]|uniref:Glucose repression mediator protein n=1 Tax=Neophaeococcomyces mojaviensis TaxID=3383035 RepID=A0ACC2ZW50_9EURO|nr:glucose repression mediator protein [Knufia sp. JES_112]
MAMPHTGHFAQVNGGAPVDAHVQRQRLLAQLNESTWQRIGSLNELTGDLDGAHFAYQQALRHNQWSTQSLTAISHILRTQEKFPEAMEYLKQVIKVEPTNGEAWGNLGHCYLMMDNLQEAYSAYQQALYYLPDPKEPKLWYGIGILYDRYGSLEHAEEAFSQVMRMQPDFEKANEIYFRLGIIYKQQQKFANSLECFKYIVNDPPKPLNEEDIWFQIGHVHEQQKDYESAKNAYRRVLDRDPKHAKVLQQLGWLHHQQSNSYQSQDQAIEYLEQSVSSDNQDAQSWYLLGRCYMAQQKFPKAYEAYQQAVYRDGRNPTFWCSIGVLYYQINQYRDALDAYSRAIRLNPYISEVWYDLGTLYESCNNQTSDALDAYQRAAELDPSNSHIKARLNLLRNGGAPGGSTQHSAPVPQDVHPQAYQNGVGMPPGGPWGSNGPSQQPPQHQVDQARVNEWQRGIAGLNNPPPQLPMSQNGAFESRDLSRIPPRAQSPRQEPPRLYHDAVRQNTTRKAQSPSPKMQSGLSGMYPPGPQTLPQINNPQERTPHLGPAPRPSPSLNGAPPQSHQAGPIGPAPPAGLPPYGRPFSPQQELRPLRDERPPSAQSNYHHPPLPPAPHFQNVNNPPPPSQPVSATESMRGDRDERPPSAMKRNREWEQEQPSKKPANDETRARLDDHSGRLYSPTGRIDTPHDRYRRSSSEIKRENERRANDNYHPSEAAHHPYSLHPHPQPPQQQIPSMQSIMDLAPREEPRKEIVEAAARKVEVDEDYDNNSEDDKRATARKASPNGSLHSTKQENAH